VYICSRQRQFDASAASNDWAATINFCWRSDFYKNFFALYRPKIALFSPFKRYFKPISTGLLAIVKIFFKNPLTSDC
jgi:hypothetical protein